MESRYELRDKIGQGGIGSVHRAYDKKMRREVAIKRILTSSEDLSLETEATKQLMAEVGALASLQHPHIVTVFDVGEDEQGPYIVMELIQGKTLDEIIESAPLVWHDFRIIAMQSLEALIAAQELDMIHSDLKPPNIMLTWLPSGAFQVKIVDFGLAVLVQNQSQEEIENMEAIYGSIFFMPPEQYERKTLDTRSDLYSLGCCFYQALTGIYPFNGSTGMEVMMSHLNHTVKPLQEIRADIPLWACHWVMWLINRYPDDRPSSAREALANFLQNDKETNPIMSRGGGNAPHARLIIPASVPSTTGPVSTSPNNLTSRTTTVQTMDGPLPTTTHAVEATAGPVGRKISKKTLIISISSAAALLLAGVTIAYIKHYNSKSGEREYQKIAAMAARDDVKEVLITSTQLKIVLDYISQSPADAYLSPAYLTLAKSKPSDGTKFDPIIVEFASTAGLAGPIRQKIFEDVIHKRASPAIVPAVIKFCVTAKEANEGMAAYNSIRKAIREDHVEGLLGIIASANANDKVKQAAEAQLRDMIAVSQNKADISKLIGKMIADVGSGPARQTLDQLLAIASPKGGTAQSNPPPKPNPAPAKPNTTPPPTPSAPQTSGTNSYPEDIRKLIETCRKGDASAQNEAIASLKKSKDPHGLFRDLFGSEQEPLRTMALKAWLDLNTQQDILAKDTRDLRQRWIQIIWRAKTDGDKQLIIESLPKLPKAQAVELLQEFTRGKDDKAAGLAKKTLESLP